MGIIFPETILFSLIEKYPKNETTYQLASSILSGNCDDFTEYALADVSEEKGYTMSPFKTGKSYLICTVTLYYVGEVEDSLLGFVILKDASWVHWTGRLSTLLKNKSFTGQTTRKPRTEYCGEVILSIGSIVSAYPWNAHLPKESIQ